VDDETPLLAARPRDDESCDQPTIPIRREIVDTSAGPPRSVCRSKKRRSIRQGAQPSKKYG
jgi:hypothetical protein